MSRASKPSQLNVVYKITAPNGWRTEWDMEFRDGAPRWVTLSRWSPENVVVLQPAPIRISAEHFFQEFEASGLASPPSGVPSPDLERKP